MPLCTLSSSDNLCPEAVRFLLVSESMIDQCRALHIPNPLVTKSNVCFGSSARSADDLPEASIIVGKETPELYWSLARVQLCSSRHIALWIEPPTSTAEQNSHLDAHPMLRGWAAKIVNIGQHPIQITRFHDHTTLSLAAGQPQYLSAFDQMIIGDPAQGHRSAVLRFVPARVADLGEKSHAASFNRSLSGASSALSSLLSAAVPLWAELDDTPRSLVSSTALISFILSDVLCNFHKISAPSSAVPLRSLSDSRVNASSLCCAGHGPSACEVAVGCLAPRAPRHEARVVDGPESLASHVSDSDAQTQQPPHSDGVCSSQVVEASPMPDAMQPRKRARSDSNATTTSASQPIIPHVTASRCPDDGNSQHSGTEVDLVAIPATVGGSSAPHHSRIAASTPPSISRDSSSTTPALPSLQESFEDRWDDHLSALEARSAANASTHTTLHNIAAVGVIGADSNKTSMLVARVNQQQISPQVLGKRLPYDLSPRPRIVPLQESQMVCFGSQE